LAALRGDLSLPSQDGWREVGSVAALYLYPVKSLAGLAVSSFSVCDTGATAGALQDRQLMVVDTRGKMVTARRYPHMVLIQPSLTGSQLSLSYPGQEDLSLELPDLSVASQVEVEVWGEKCRGVECEVQAGTLVSSWLSSVILARQTTELRLVCHRPAISGSSRPAKPANSYLHPLQEGDRDRPLYADGYPYLLLSRPSVARLNSVLQQTEAGLTVEEKRFRPNISVTGDFQPFAEDK